MSKQKTSRWVSMFFAVVGAVVVSSVGWLTLVHTYGSSLTRMSYDLPFLFRTGPDKLKSGEERPHVCIVYMDENAGRMLGQQNNVWDRRMHVKLLEKLTADGAKAVFFDLLFLDPDPSVDDAFAEAIKKHGNVFIGAGVDQAFNDAGPTDQVFPPTDKLADAVADWGLVAFRPVDVDHGVRALYAGSDSLATATWLMAMKLGAPLQDDPDLRAQPRWINYYGPVGHYESLGYERCILPDGVPSGYFKDKVVFVGGRTSVATVAMGKDDFAYPYTLWTPVTKGARFIPGVDIHATIFLNLVSNDWLVRWSAGMEEWFVLIYGAIIAFILPRFRPILAVGIGLVVGLLVMTFAFWLSLKQLTWFVWGVPVLLQTPLAIGWATLTRYFLEERKRNQLKKAFTHYLSKDMVERISNSEVDLAPGGDLMETTIIFTDLEGFTNLSEKLADPRKLSEVLIAYFTRTTQHVHQNQGTVIKFIGDAVLAVWGAPLPDPQHPLKAALSAWLMQQASAEPVLDHKLVTRIGVHSGEVLAGNLGSEDRFDYTVIGDAVNLAARLEGLNKYFGTRILISETTAAGLEGRFITRPLGFFRVVGKAKAICIHELVAPSEPGPPEPWLEVFATGVREYCEGRFEDAARSMLQVCDMRGGNDGPSRFYLHKIEEALEGEKPEAWDGVIEFTSK